MPFLPVSKRHTLHKQKNDPLVQSNYEKQSERLGQYTNSQDETGATKAVEALFVTAQDPIIEVVNGGRLPAVPIEEAIRLNRLKAAVEGVDVGTKLPVQSGVRESRDGTIHGASSQEILRECQSVKPGAELGSAKPPSRTDPLFPPVPLYGPSSPIRTIQCYFFRFSSFFLSLAFLCTIVLGAMFTSVPSFTRRLCLQCMQKDPDASRPFYKEERKRKAQRQQDIMAYNNSSKVDQYKGPDPLICGARYYARREGLDLETYEVQTEDGFIIELQHVYDPKSHQELSEKRRRYQSPDIFNTDPEQDKKYDLPKQYPVLLMHGLLQSSGAYCCTGPGSLAFYLCKSGYDVWLGNNRCGFTPKHVMLDYSDPRMWAWNIRQMGVLDLAALISRVLSETHSPKLALVAHSQGTTQTFVALAKEQRPELGQKISVFCALAPAAYAGPLIDKAYLKFIGMLTPGLFNCVFGIHAFIPIMMLMHTWLPGKLYAKMGYLVFNFLFDWSDTRWDKGLRDRCFQFAPTYVSSESMRWWLGRESFAKQQCILSTQNEGKLEDDEDNLTEAQMKSDTGSASSNSSEDGIKGTDDDTSSDLEERSKFAWYNDNFPPLAIWVAGNDKLVDGPRLLRRFNRGREPHVKLVHQKVIKDYEHLDVIWAMDCIDQVGVEIRDIIWKTMPSQSMEVSKPPVDVGAAFSVNNGVKNSRANVQESELEDDEKADLRITHEAIDGTTTTQ